MEVRRKRVKSSVVITAEKKCTEGSGLGEVSQFVKSHLQVLLLDKLEVEAFLGNKLCVCTDLYDFALPNNSDCVGRLH